MIATESVALSQVRLLAAKSCLDFYLALGNREQIAIARDLVTLWTNQLNFWTNMRDQLLGELRRTVCAHDNSNVQVSSRHTKESRVGILI